MKLYKNQNPAVSVIIPTFNREKLLQRAIDSVLSQSYKDWEIIVVDDGSSDDSYKYVFELQNEYPNIKYIRHSNRKLPITMNSGIRLAAGKYVTFLGSDDEYKSDHLQLRVEYMENHPEIELIHGGVDIIGTPYVKDKEDRSKWIHLDQCVIGGTFFGVKRLFHHFNGFNDVYYSEDSDFFDRISGKAKIAKVNYPTYIYHRETEDSIATNIE